MLLSRGIMHVGTAWASSTMCSYLFFFFSSRRRHTRFDCDWSSDVCSSDLIWLSLLKKAASSSETTYFVSSDKKAFKTDQCLVDANEAGAVVEILTDISDLLVQLADQVQVKLDESFPNVIGLARPKILQYILESGALF